MSSEANSETPASEKKKAVEFHASLTQEFLIAFAIDMSIAIGVAILGFRCNHIWRDGRGYIFVAVGALLGTLGIVIARATLNRSIRLTGADLQVRIGAADFTCAWKNLRTFIPSKHGKMWFRKTVVGDASKSVGIDSASFKEYDEIVKLIATTRKQAQDAAHNKAQQI